MLLDKIYYTVNSLEGDYAYLKKEDDASDELKCVARALLPAEIVEGSRLVYEMMEYSIVSM
ncbi:MAG: chorismate--pyruvate lyase [Lachnospiraceae bacterium]|nr:chorismate--pyruvate lyase [Lachnospiraceae bacterium]